jgi:hypothetical protein
MTEVSIELVPRSLGGVAGAERAHALAWARAGGTNLYFMPIRVDLETWLGGIL